MIRITRIVLIGLILSFHLPGHGAPAARQGDAMASGGIIVNGFPTVLINGRPAARVGDLTIDPRVIVFVPCVGGPIIQGSPTVLIGSLPAARVGDNAASVCGPVPIAIGSPNVLIR